MEVNSPSESNMKILIEAENCVSIMHANETSIICFMFMFRQINPCIMKIRRNKLSLPLWDERQSPKHYNVQRQKQH